MAPGDNAGHWPHAPPSAQPSQAFLPLFCRFTNLQAKNEAATKRSRSTVETTGRRTLSCRESLLETEGRPMHAAFLQPQAFPHPPSSRGGHTPCHLQTCGFPPGCPQGHTHTHRRKVGDDRSRDWSNAARARDAKDWHTPQRPGQRPGAGPPLNLKKKPTLLTPISGFQPPVLAGSRFCPLAWCFVTAAAGNKSTFL